MKKSHTPEQIVRKLREADAELNWQKEEDDDSTRKRILLPFLYEAGLIKDGKVAISHIVPTFI